MRVTLINTGTELLLGDVQDTHLAFIAKEILPLGLRIEERRTVPDGAAIRDTLEEILSRADLIFVTGGLGPTSDDITREIVADLLDLPLVRDEGLFGVISERLAKRHIKLTDSIGRQAMVPRGAEVLPNDNGSAPGLFFARNLNSLVPSPPIFLLPGPPRELQPMFRDYVALILRKIATAPAIERRLYKIANMGESVVEQKIGAAILAIPGIELGYCARPSEVDLRIIGEPKAIAQADQIVRAELGTWIYSTDDENLEEVLVTQLAARKDSLATAESCTGGLLAHRITNVPGSSEVLLAGYVTYANETKIDVLNVDRELLKKHGAVSEPVAKAMAEGARKRATSTYGLSTTGIAGPGGGSDEKPVGTVYVGLATPNETVVNKFYFPNERVTFKDQTAQAAFDMLRRKVLSA